MYVPQLFKVNNEVAIEEFIRKYGFATLITVQSGQPQAVHLPLHLSIDGTDRWLYGHIAMANSIKKQCDGRQTMLAIFMQPHAYVSSSWYDHVNVPTWNYISVHAYGAAHIITDLELYNSLSELVDSYEQGREDRFYMHQFEKNELEAHLRGLVGFKMKIDRWEVAFKLSQNRNDVDYQNIITHLESGNLLEQEIAREMKKLRS